MFQEHPFFALYILGVIGWWMWMWMDKDRRQTMKDMNDYLGGNQKKAGQAIAKAGETGYRVFKLFRRR